MDIFFDISLLFTNIAPELIIQPPTSDDKIKGVTIHEFENCSNDRQVMLYSVHEAGHGYLDNFLPPGRHSGGTIDTLWKFFNNNPK